MLLAGLASQRLVILSTHIIGDVEAVAGRLVVLNHGRLVADTSPEALLAGAVGQVWPVTTDAATARRLQTAHQVRAMVQQPSGVALRIVSSAQPHELATPVEPTLEDAYLLAVGQEGLPI